MLTASGVADGPFVESKEVIGGFMILSAPDYDAAVEVVRACPAKIGGDSRGAAEYIKLADGILRIVGQLPERDITPDKLKF